MTESNPGTMVCANHPDRPTYLRCNRCNKPICQQCAVLTPTGYRCKECVRGQQRTFETAHNLDYVLAGGIALVISFLGSYIAPVMGFFTIFIAPILGMIASEVIRRVVNHRRSRLLFQIAAAGAVVGALPLLGNSLLVLLARLSGSLAFSLNFVWPVIWLGVYLFLITSTLYFRLSGIRM